MEWSRGDGSGGGENHGMRDGGRDKGEGKDGEACTKITFTTVFAGCALEN